MKRYFFLVCLCLLYALPMFATPQVREVVYINGKEQYMCFCPLSQNARLDSLFAKKWDVKMQTTALWRGYVGHWSVKENMLCLDSIVIERGKPAVIPQQDKELFGDYMENGRVVARWLTVDTIRVTWGKNVRYEHGGYGGNYENEDYYQVKEGKMKLLRHTENKLLVKAGRLGDIEFERKVSAMSDTLREVMAQLCPTLYGRYMFSAQYMGVDANGKPTDVDLKLMMKDKPESLDPALKTLHKEVKRYLLSHVVLDICSMDGVVSSERIILPVTLRTKPEEPADNKPVRVNVKYTYP